MIFSSRPSKRVWFFLMSWGSNSEWRSRGTSICIWPRLPRKVFGVVPLRELPESPREACFQGFGELLQEPVLAEQVIGFFETDLLIIATYTESKKPSPREVAKYASPTEIIKRKSEQERSPSLLAFL